MDVNALSSATITLGYGFLAALVSIVVTQLLMGRINTRGLLRVKRPEGTAGVSPPRVLLLLATLSTATTYLAAIMNARTSGRLPELPAGWLDTVAASQGVYLATKASKFFPILATLRRITGQR